MSASKSMPMGAMGDFELPWKEEDTPEVRDREFIAL